MGLCKVVRSCCPCCCCCRSNKADNGKRKRKVRFQEVDMEVQEATMEMEEYEPYEQEKASVPDNLQVPVTDLSQINSHEQACTRTQIQVLHTQSQAPGKKEEDEPEDSDDTEADEGDGEPDSDSGSVQDIDEDESDSDDEAEDDDQFLQEPDPGTEFILSKFRKEITKALLKEFPYGNQDPEFLLIGYTSHFVAGTDYFLKIYEQISGHYFHVRVYESLQGDLILQRMSAPKRFEDPILYF